MRKQLMAALALMVACGSSLMAAGTNYVDWTTVQENLDAGLPSAVTIGIYVLSILIVIPILIKIVRRFVGR